MTGNEAGAGSPFSARGPDDIRKLIDCYPLAWVHAQPSGEASLLPLIGVYNERNELLELIGHFARSNPINKAFAQSPCAEIIFTGPQGYVSPSYAGRRDWAPTWNYAQLRIKADIIVDENLTSRALDDLIDHVERNREQPWSSSELGERYERLMPRILGFRARVVSLKEKFKLGQDETLEDLRAILSNMPESDLVQWMRLFNNDRLRRAYGDG